MNLKPLDNLIAFYRNLHRSMLDAADAAIMASADNITDLNRQQLTQGVDEKGQPITYQKRRQSELNSTGAYTEKYAKYKNKYGRQTSVVDLKLTGEYVNSLRLDRVSVGVYRIYAEQNEDLQYILEDNYTNKIHGLTDQNLQQVSSNLVPRIDAEIQRLIDRI